MIEALKKWQKEKDANQLKKDKDQEKMDKAKTAA